MKRLNRHRRLALCNFSSPEHDAASTGLSAKKLSEVIHARWANGMVMTGVEAFPALWEVGGLGGSARRSRLPFVKPVPQRGYTWFAETGSA